jgi:hypothetical protein
MSCRFPAERGQLPAAQQAVYDLIAARRGAVPPPYLPLLASPETADALEKLSTTLWSGRLGKDVQEAVYLVTARAYRCDGAGRSVRQSDGVFRRSRSVRAGGVLRAGGGDCDLVERQGERLDVAIPPVSEGRPSSTRMCLISSRAARHIDPWRLHDSS